MTDSGRILVIGDVHGCDSMLKRLVDKVDWQPQEDRLIFVGDYIDRGENPKGVVDYILSLARLSPYVQGILGNHEALFLDFLSGKNQDLYYFNGGGATLRSYQKDGSEAHGVIPADHLSFYQSLEPLIELDEYYIVHAGFRPGIRIERQSIEDMTWIREPFIYSDYDFGKKVIFGHTPLSEPLVMANKIGLDTGAVYGNKLTCFEVREERFFSVSA